MSRANRGGGRRTRWGAQPSNPPAFHGYSCAMPMNPLAIAPPSLMPMPPVSFFNPRVPPPTRHVPHAPEFEVTSAANSLNERRTLLPHPHVASSSSSSLDNCNLTVQLKPNSTRKVTARMPVQLQPQVPVIAESTPATSAATPSTPPQVVPQRIPAIPSTPPETKMTIKAEEGSKDRPIQIDDDEGYSSVKHECSAPSCDIPNRVLVDVKSELAGEVPLRVIKSEYCNCCGTPKRLTVMLRCHKQESRDSNEPGTAAQPILIDDDMPSSDISDAPATAGSVAPANDVDSPASPTPSDSRVEDLTANPVRIPLTPMHCLSPDPMPQIPAESEKRAEAAIVTATPEAAKVQMQGICGESDDGMLPDSEDEPYITDSDSDTEVPQRADSSPPLRSPVQQKQRDAANSTIVNMDRLAMLMQRRYVKENRDFPEHTVNATLTANDALNDVLQDLNITEMKLIITVRGKTLPPSASPITDVVKQHVGPPSNRLNHVRRPSPPTRKAAKYLPPKSEKRIKKKPKRRITKFDVPPISKKRLPLSRRASLALQTSLPNEPNEETRLEPERCEEPPSSPQPDEFVGNTEMRPLSPTSEMRALALASMPQPVAIIPSSPTRAETLTEDIPLPPPPPEPEMELIPPPPPPPEMEEANAIISTAVGEDNTHEKDNATVVDMDVTDDDSAAPSPPIAAAPSEELSDPLPSTVTIYHPTLFRLDGANIKIVVKPTPTEETKRRLMSGTVHEDHLPQGCPRPQQALGRSFPEKKRKAFEEDGDSDGNSENCYKSRSISLRKVASESYVTEKGRIAPGFLPPFALKRRMQHLGSFQAPPPKRFGNRTMRVINGKRVFSDSNSCYEFLEKGTCSGGIFCRFSHGEAVPAEKKICSRMLRGQCRGDRGCQLNHDLPTHQFPTCDFFLRYSCSHDDCCFLHVKHPDDTPPCEAFNNGTCKDGTECRKSHRYIYRTVKMRGEVPNDGTGR